MAGLASAGVDVLLLGVLPTPGVAYLTGALGADLGVMLSASHNPMPDNGIKFLARGGRQARRRHRGRDRGAARASRGTARPAATSAGSRPYDAAVERVRRPPGRDDRPARSTGLKVVLDCAHGAAYEAGPRALREAGAEVVAIRAEPDGLNINDGCGSTHLERAAGAPSLEHGADAGFALDGDADRCLAVDHEGNVVDGDQILAILALGDARRRPARRGHRRGHGDEQPRLRAGDARRPASACARPRSATATCSRRCRSPATSLGGEQSGHVIMSELRHHRRRHPHRAARAASGWSRPARSLADAGLRGDPAAAGAGQRPRRRQGARRRGRRAGRGASPRRRPRSATPAGSCCAPRAPSRWCG